MSWPGESTARSGAPGSLWWTTVDTAGQRYVWATQWDALVRRFQDRASRMIPPLYAFPANGDCGSIAAIARANIRRRDKITQDGVFGPETRDLLGYLLCSSGGTEFARQLARETANGTISDQTLKNLILFANHVTAVGSPEDPEVAINIDPSQLTLPAGVVLPRWLERVVSTASDSDWQGLWIEGQPPPIAPSLRGMQPQTSPPVDAGDTTIDIIDGSTVTPTTPPRTNNTTTTTTTTTAAPLAWYDEPVIQFAGAVLVFGGALLFFNDQNKRQAHGSR